jgi:anti-sigma B factor antagonist
MDTDDVEISFIRVETPQGELQLHVRGDLDIATSGLLSHELHDMIDLDRPYIGVDLSGVSFIDSSALSVLVRTHERAESKGHRLQLLNPSAACVKVFTITGLDRVFGLSQS